MSRPFFSFMPLFTEVRGIGILGSPTSDLRRYRKFSLEMRSVVT
jgi:hypothetical protein